MNEEKNTNTEELTTLDVVKEEYEKKLADVTADFERRMKEMHETHIAEIRTLMTSGTSSEAEQIAKETNPYDEAIANLRKKYKLN